MPIRVALNLIFLVPGETGGMEVYARELISRLASDDQVELTCLVNREASAIPGPWQEAGNLLTAPVRASNRFEWVRGEQWYVPRLAADAGAEVLHSLGNTGPVWGRQVRVLTVHDLIYLKAPDHYKGLRALGVRGLVPAAVRRSDRLIADSGSTRQDLVSGLGADAGKIDVVPLAAAEPAVEPTPEKALREKLSLGDRRVLFSPGAARPHKNAELILEGVAALPRSERPLIVVSGYDTSHSGHLSGLALELGVADDFLLAGNLPQEDLEGLYLVSSIVAMPSRYEGFGLPVLEAMKRGVPVIASNTSSLPEVAGSAAILVSPDSSGQMRDAIQAILGDGARAARMVEEGYDQAARFSWEKTAELTVQSYRRALGRE